MPLQQTSGNVTADAYGGGAAAKANYIEDVFSTWLYTGNGSTQTITNGIDLAGNGGMVWMKSRSGATDHAWYDTARGATFDIASNLTAAQTMQATGLTGFTSTGFSISTLAKLNTNAVTYASWTFRKQPKFFDVVTYTGNGVTNRAIPHALGSIPGCIIIKRTDAASDWGVMSRQDGGAPDTYFTGLKLNATNAQTGTYSFAGDLTSTTFKPWVDPAAGLTAYNVNGATYVAYLFAHNAGGFGMTGTGNVISCGSFTCDGTSRATVNLGYEPQWLLLKSSNTAQAWFLVDTMRGWVNGAADNTSDDKPLYPNLSNAEGTDYFGYPTATGFQMYTGNPSGQYIYIAIRRGPMKVPTDGTSVLGLNARTGTNANATVTGGVGATDLAIIKNRDAASVNWLWASRLTNTGYLVSNSTAAEVAATTATLQSNPWDVNNGVKVGAGATQTNDASSTYINFLIDRAPGFFDEVCYTGAGTTQTINHNLGVAPELIISKTRSGVGNWWVWYQGIVPNNNLKLNLSDALSPTGGQIANSVTATSFLALNGSNNTTDTRVAYLFASCPGVSKVGRYTGNGSTQTINCGFTGGARFVLIKRTDSTGDWYVYDTARGMTTLTDPYLLLNSTAAESATLGSVTTVTTGFAVNAAVLAAINTNAASYIFLAIA